MCDRRGTVGKRKLPRGIIILRPERVSVRLDEWQPTCLNRSWRGIMHLYGTRVFERQNEVARRVRGQAGHRLRAVAAVMLTLVAGVPSGFAQQATTTPQDKAASSLPAAPTPTPTEPLSLRQTQRDFSLPAGRLMGNPLNSYRATNIDAASFRNSVRLDNLVKDGKIYLSLSDALALAIENNYDIAIARYNLDIADTDILRTRAGSALRG